MGAAAPARGGRGVFIAPYEGSQRHRYVALVHDDDVFIAPYEGSQHQVGYLTGDRHPLVFIAPYEGSQHQHGRRGLRFLLLSSSLPTRDRN